MTGHDDRPRYDPRGRQRVFMAIADDLTAKIVSGYYPPDARLPSVADLVHEYGAARETVRKAIRLLADQGYVEIIPGKGTYANPADRWQRDT